MLRSRRRPTGPKCARCLAPLGQTMTRPIRGLQSRQGSTKIAGCHRDDRNLKGAAMISTRRSILAALLASPALGLTEINFTSADTTLDLDLTPDCHDGDERTVAEAEGPYFKPNAPLKRDLAADAPR